MTEDETQLTKEDIKDLLQDLTYLKAVIDWPSTKRVLSKAIKYINEHEGEQHG